MRRTWVLNGALVAAIVGSLALPGWAESPKMKMTTPIRPGKENNWVQTIPGKGWNTLLRLYGPLEPWFNKSWRPGEIELVE